MSGEALDVAYVEIRPRADDAEFAASIEPGLQTIERSVERTTDEIANEFDQAGKHIYAELTRVGAQIGQTFDEASDSATNSLEQIGGPGTFEGLSTQADLVSRQISGAFEQAQQASDDALGDIGGPALFTDVVIQAEVAAAAIEHAFDDAADELDTSLGGIGEQASGGLVRGLFTADPDLVQSLVRPFATSLATPVGAAIVGALVAAVTPLLIATLSAALLGGIGAAFLGIGAFALRENAKLKKELEGTGKTISGVLERAAAPLQGPFIRALELVGAGFERWEAPLNRIFTQIAPAVEPLVVGLLGIVDQLLPGLEAALPSIVAALTALGAALPEIGTALAFLFTIIAENQGTITAAINAIVELAAIIIRILAVALSYGLSSFQNLVTGVRIAETVIRAASESIANAVGVAFRFIQSIVLGTTAAVVNRVSSSSGTIRAIFSSTWSAAQAIVSGAWARISGAVSNGVERVTSVARSLPGRIRGALGNLGGTLVSAGRAIVDGLINGITSRLSAALNTVRNLGAQIANAARSALRIGSPSKEFEEIGQNVIAGFTQGVDRGRPAVIESITNTTRATTEIVSPSAAIASLRGGGGTGGGGITVYGDLVVRPERFDRREITEEVENQQRALYTGTVS